MKATVTIFDEVRCQFTGIQPEHIKYLIEKHSYFVEGYKFQPKYKLGVWDGKVSFVKRNGETSNYLMPSIVVQLKKLGYNIIVDDKRTGVMYDVIDDVDANYFSHITNPKSNEPYQLTEHQIDVANKMIAAGSGIALAGTGFGKAQPYHCKVLTPDGWKTMGELQIGDYVITPTNKRVKINGIFEQGITDVYKITLTDGGVTYAHPEHLWKVYYQQWTDKDTFETFQTINTLDLKKRLGICHVFLPQMPCAIDFDEKEWEVHPYVLGALLPFVTYNETFGLHIYSFDPSMFAFFFPRDVENIFKMFGFDVEYEHQITILKPTERSQLLYDVLLRMLENKEFDDCYLFTTAKARLQFLQGMCDVGGVMDVVGMTSVPIYNTWICEQLTEMIQLQGGFINELNQKRKKHRKYYVMSFSHHIPNIWYSKPKDIATEYFKRYTTEYDQTKRRTKRKVKSVILEGQMATRCISIDDPDHLYITDSCIITHNTILNAVLVDKYNKQGCKTLTIVPATTLIKQTIDQFEALGLNTSHFNSKNTSLEYDHLVTTWQTLQNYPTLISQFQMVVVDECLDGSTYISTPSGDKQIKDIVEGDIVFSYNVQTNCVEQDVVVKTHKNLMVSSSEKMYRLEFDKCTIEVTGNHKILTSVGYKRADELTDTDEIIEF